MRSSQLRAFDAVAQTGSFTQAAINLGVTQPAVTVQVRALEQAYGVRLLSRGSGAVNLTADGRDLFALTRQLFAVEDSIEARLTAGRALEHGSLQLAADGPHVALEVLARFRAVYPGIETKVTLGNAQETWAAVAEQRADAAILANPPRDSRVSAISLCRQEHAPADAARPSLARSRRGGACGAGRGDRDPAGGRFQHAPDLGSRAAQKPRDPGTRAGAGQPRSRAPRRSRSALAWASSSRVKRLGIRASAPFRWPACVAVVRTAWSP